MMLVVRPFSIQLGCFRPRHGSRHWFLFCFVVFFPSLLLAQALIYSFNRSGHGGEKVNKKTATKLDAFFVLPTYFYATMVNHTELGVFYRFF